MPMRLGDLATTLAIMMAWGLNFPISKIGFSEIPPLLMVALRFGVVAVVLLPFAGFPRRRMKHIAGLSLTLGSIHFSLMFVGLDGVDASMAALLTPIQVPFAAVLAVFVFRERITLRLVLGLLVAFLGVALIAGRPQAGDLVPALLILAAAMVWGVANVQLKFVAGMDPLSLTFWIALFTAPQLFAISLVLERDHLAVLAAAGWRGWFAVFWQAIVVAILSYVFWYKMLRRYPVNLMMPMTLLTNVFAVLFSVLLLGERLTLQLVAGGLATIAGVAITSLRKR